MKPPPNLFCSPWGGEISAIYTHRGTSPLVVRRAERTYYLGDVYFEKAKD